MDPNTVPQPPHSCLQTGLRVLVNGLGLGLVVLCLTLLYFNEVSLMHAAKDLREAKKLVVSAPANVIDPHNEGKLVHVAGLLEPGQPLSDPEFGVEVRALKLTRQVEMYQWAEITHTERRSEGGRTIEHVVYDYVKRWEDRLIDAAKFQTPAGHENPKSMPGGGKAQPAQVAGDAKLGAYRVHPAWIEKVAGDRLLYQENADPPQDVPLPVYAARGLRAQRMPGGDPGWMYFGKDVNAPELGDIRVRYRFVPPTEVTIVARQTAGELEWLPGEGRHPTIKVLRNGIANAEDALEEEVLVNHLGSWFIRFVLGFALAAGLAMSVATWRKIPGLRRAAGARWWIFGLLGAAGLSFIAIGAPWVMVRPLLGVSLLVLGAVLLSSLHRLGARTATRA